VGAGGYLAESGRGLRLDVTGRIRLEYRSGLLATCLSAIVKVAESEKVEEIRQSVEGGTSGESTHPNLGFW